jgi:lipoprotein-anchoring transpeptidase ErfK/SrfK
VSGVIIEEPRQDLEHSHRNPFKVFLALGLALFVFILGAHMAASAAYAGRFYPGTKISGQDIGGLTKPQAEDLLRSEAGNSRVKFVIQNHRYVAKPVELGVRYQIESSVNRAYLQNHNRDVLLSLIRPSSEVVSLAYSVDRVSFEQFVNKVVLAAGKQPVDATVVVNNGVPSIQPGQNGYAVGEKQLSSLIEAQLADPVNNAPEIGLTTQKPTLQPNNIAPVLDKTKKLIETPITITSGSKTFKPGPAEIGKWLTFEKSINENGDPGLDVKINNDAIKFYLQSVAKAVNVNPVNHKVTIQNGVTTEDQAGVDGQILDQDSLAAKLATAVTSGQALSTETPMQKVAFKTEYNRTVSLDYGQYIEINLSRQHMWVYENHNVIYQSPVTSGATGAGFPTVQGLFSIQAKQTNRNLNGYAIGYNYNVFVHYWMPFYGNYGLHDASWRSSFGGPDYYYGGSHGCVNLPDSAAAFLYGWASVGTPVWVHS